MINKKIISEIERRTDMVSVVSEYVKLTKKRGDFYLGLCPFHDEKTPSLAVIKNNNTQYFHCFGCGKKGYVFHFIQEIKHVDFFQAVNILAKRLGIDLSN